MKMRSIRITPLHSVRWMRAGRRLILRIALTEPADSAHGVQTLLEGRKAAICPAERTIVMAAIGFLALLAALMQTSCAHSPPVWQYYDQCAQENPSFLAMAECGKQKRLAECTASNACSPEGTTFMEYIDSLALAVKKQATDRGRG